MSADRQFTFRSSTNGTVTIHDGKTLAATLRGVDAKKFLSRAEGASDDALQQLMARLTGNYKRGNERKAQTHPRNS